MGSSYPQHKFLHKLEVSVFQMILFYDPFFYCRLSLRAGAPQRALSLFLRSLCSVPGFPSSLLLGTQQLTFLLFFLIPLTYLIFLITTVGAGILLSMKPQITQGREESPGVSWGFSSWWFPSLSSEGLWVGSGAHSKWPEGIMGPRYWLGWLLFANLQVKKAKG